MSTPPPVAVVTGASRGAGRGIARALGGRGWRVYLTGRTVDETAAREVTDAGGEGIAVCVDHADDASVAALFRRVADENGGLQLLVNNAALIHEQLTDPSPFWDKPSVSATCSRSVCGLPTWPAGTRRHCYSRPAAA